MDLSRKLLIPTLILLLIFESLTPINVIATLNHASNISFKVNSTIKNFLSAIDRSSLVPNAVVVSIDNKPYLYLGHGLKYPLDGGSKIFKIVRLPNGKKVYVLYKNWTKYMLKLIIVYHGMSEYKSRLINLIHRFGGFVNYSYTLFPMISATIPAGNVSRLLDYSIRIDICADYKVYVKLNESVPIIKPPDKWKDIEKLYGRGLNGSGIIIGILDTGVDIKHPDFFFPNGTSKCIYSISFVPHENASDGFGHGTHVAGIALGTGLASNGKFKGVAPGALLANIKVLSNEGYGYISWIIKGIEYAINKSINVINLSLGGGFNGDGSDPLSIAVDTAVKHGIVVVVAAGNSGPYYYSLSSPGVAKGVITVGAIAKNLTVADFSSRGPTGDLRIKPDVLAPGVNIIAPVARGSYLEKLFMKRYPREFIRGKGGNYIILSGTSMATPHVSGLAALILQAHPDYTPELVKSVITSTSRDLGYNPFIEGAGLINACNAVLTPVIPDKAVKTLGLLYNGSGSLKYVIKNLSDKRVKLKSIKVISRDIHDRWDNSKNIIIKFSKEVLDPYSYISLQLYISGIVHPSVYYLKLILEFNNSIRLTLLASYAYLARINLNTTYNGIPCDVLYVIYRVSEPDRLILPSGYKYDNVSNFAWFYLEPGQYNLFVVTLNYPSENESFIKGPFYISTRSIYVPDIGNYSYSIKIESGYKAIPPRESPAGLTLYPYYYIVALYTPANKSIGVFISGLWNISNFILYNDLTTNDKVFLHLEYIEEPVYTIRGNLSERLRCYNTLYMGSWILTKSIRGSLEFNTLRRYRLILSSQIDNDIAYLSLIDTPPKYRYTYIAVIPCYQGGLYYVELSKPLYDESQGFLTFDKGMILIRNICLFSPRYDISRIVRALSPPYFPFIDVSRYIKNNNTLYNITVGLTTSILPFNVVGDGNSSIELYRNGMLIYRDYEVGDIDYFGLRNRILDFGNYRVLTRFDLNYPLYYKVHLDAGFKIPNPDISPPLILSVNVPYVTERSNTGSILLLDLSGLDHARVRMSLDGGITWFVVKSSIKSSRYGLYRRYNVTFNIPRFKRGLCIEFYASDIYGNYIFFKMYNITISKLLTYNRIPEVVVKPGHYIMPNKSANISISYSYNDQYAIRLYVDGSFKANIPIDGSNTSLILPDVIRSGKIGSHIVELKLDYNILRKAYTIMERIHVTKLIVNSYAICINGSIKNTLDNRYHIDVGSELIVGFHIVWKHDNSSVDNARVYLSNGLVLNTSKGYVLIRLKSNKVKMENISISKIIYDYDGYVDIFEARIKPNIQVIWDTVIIESLNKTIARFENGSHIKICFKAYYAFNKKPFKGVIVINNTLAVNGTGIFKVLISEDKVGEYRYIVTGIRDDLYNLTTFKQAYVDVIFDHLKVDVKYSTSFMHVSITIYVRWMSDLKPVRDASVLINNVHSIMVEPGLYKYSEFTIMPFSEYNISIYKSGFKMHSIKLEVTNIDNITAFSIIIILLCIIITYIIKRLIKK